MSVTVLFYNWGFFTLLAYTPFPMHLGIHQLGYVFTGWGVMVAVFALFVAQRLQLRFGTPRCLYVNFFLMAVDLGVIAAFTSSQTALIVAVIVSGAFIGLNITLTTQAVMLVSRRRTAGGFGVVRVRPVHRRRTCPLLRLPHGLRLERPHPLLGCRRQRDHRDRRPGLRALDPSPGPSRPRSPIPNPSTTRPSSGPAMSAASSQTRPTPGTYRKSRAVASLEVKRACACGRRG